MSTTAAGEHFERTLREVLWILRAYLPDLVLIGGWVPFLHRRYGGYARWDANLSGTIELDLLVTPPLERTGREALPNVLRDAGFEPADSGRAVWERDIARGEKLEFMIDHQGTARTRGAVMPVAGQEDVGAISLERLGILRRSSMPLTVPVRRTEQGIEALTVHVPRLGAFAINKAITMPQRRRGAGTDDQVKQAKDVLYLRDLMAAGGEVVETIERDLEDAVDSEHEAEVRMARGNVYLILHGALRRLVPEAADMLAARDRLSPAAAEADVEGHLVDLLEVLDGALDRRAE